MNDPRDDDTTLPPIAERLAYIHRRRAGCPRDEANRVAREILERLQADAGSAPSPESLVRAVRALAATGAGGLRHPPADLERDLLLRLLKLGPAEEAALASFLE